MTDLSLEFGQPGEDHNGAAYKIKAGRVQGGKRAEASSYHFAGHVVGPVTIPQAPAEVEQGGQWVRRAAVMR